MLSTIKRGLLVAKTFLCRYHTHTHARNTLFPLTRLTIPKKACSHEAAASPWSIAWHVSFQTPTSTSSPPAAGPPAPTLRTTGTSREATPGADRTRGYFFLFLTFW